MSKGGIHVPDYFNDDMADSQINPSSNSFNEYASVAEDFDGSLAWQQRKHDNDHHHHHGEDGSFSSNSTVPSDGDAHDSEHPKTSLLRTFINFIKGNIGTGILAMPDAFKNAGLYFGSFSLLFLGFLATYCCHQLLHAYQLVSGGEKALAYSEVMYLVFRRARPSSVRKMAKASRYVINSFLVVTQIGICCVYILFTSRMIKEVVDDAAPAFGWDIIHYASLVVALLIPYCFVTTLQVLSIFSLFANFATLITLVVSLQFVFRNLQAVEDVDYFPPSFSTVPLFFGTAMFAFECIAMILPMENQMADRAAFHGWNGLFSMCMACVVCLYVVVGFYGYLAFGVDAMVILSNLPKGDWLYNSVKLLYAASIFLSYNLQFYVLVRILYPPIRRWVNKDWFDKFGEYIFRAVLVLFTYALAVGIPCLELMISLTGSLAMGSLGLVFPPMLELVCCMHRDAKRSYFKIAKCVLLLGFGLFGVIIGSVVAIQSIVNALQSPGGCSSQ